MSQWSAVRMSGHLVRRTTQAFRAGVTSGNPLLMGMDTLEQLTTWLPASQGVRYTPTPDGGLLPEGVLRGLLAALGGLRGLGLLN